MDCFLYEFINIYIHFVKKKILKQRKKKNFFFYINNKIKLTIFSDKRINDVYIYI